MRYDTDTVRRGGVLVGLPFLESVIRRLAALSLNITYMTGVGNKHVQVLACFNDTKRPFGKFRGGLRQLFRSIKAETWQATKTTLTQSTIDVISSFSETTYMRSSVPHPKSSFENI